MKYIEVKFWGTKDVSRIILEEDKIKVESENEEDRLFFADLIKRWETQFKLKGEELFNRIPDITSHYSRMFFSGILE
jgi:hypothetical protein